MRGGQERRADIRVAMAEPTRATLRPGCEVAVIDLSAGGALVEGSRPLRPGARVHVQLVTRGRTVAVTAHVVRCLVWTLDAVHGVVYRGALHFDQPCSLVREERTRPEYALPRDPSGKPSRDGAALPAVDLGASAARRSPGQ